MATEIVEINASPEAADGLDEFAALEAKIARVAEALQKARAERDQAAAALQALQAEQRAAERELVALRKERIEIRNRVARLTKHLEAAEA